MKDSLKIIKPDIVPTLTKYAECLHKRSGKADEPVIIMNNGGDKSVGNCSLVGYEEGDRNVWSFTAKFDSPIFEGDTGSYSVVWDVDGGQVTSGSVTGGQGGDTPTISVKYRAGRYEPGLRVYRTVSGRRTLVGTAAIHSINVYSGSVDGAEWVDEPVAEDDRYGTEMKLARNHDESVEVNVRALVDVKAQGACRARISPDGYPQNEYWMTGADSGDLPQPYTFQPDGNRKGWAQGYGDPSPSENNLSVRIRSSKSYAEDTTSAKFSTIMVNAGVDLNRNDSITFDDKDRTSPMRPHVFWTNSNRDVDVYDEAQGRIIPQDANPSGGQVDSSLGAIPNVRDLQDWMRFTVKAVGAVSIDTLSKGKSKLRLRASGGLGLAYTKMAKEENGVDYLFNEAAANEQAREQGEAQNPNSHRKVIGRFGSNSHNDVPFDSWSGAGLCPLLIEGTNPGNGRIICEVIDGENRIVGRANVFMKLEPANKLYEHWTVGDTTARGAEIQEPHLTGDSARYGEDNDLLSAPDSDRGIAFVHGWRMEPWERRAFAETALKRLYWARYKGKFALFSWPTEYMEVMAFLSDIAKPVNGDVRNYDRSEFQARKVGRMRFAPWVQARKSAWGCSRFDVMAHSMGNIVVCEALHGSSGQMCNYYYSCQSAEVAHTVYDRAALITEPTIRTSIPLPFLSEITVPLSKQENYLGPNLYKYSSPINPRMTSNGPTGGGIYHSGIGDKCGSFINLYNNSDQAMGNQVANQLYKPDVGYGYEFRHDELPGSTWWHRLYKPEGYDRFLRGSFFTDVLAWPNDSAEILSFIVQERSVPLGNLGEDGGEVTEVRPLSPALIQNIEKEHSAQFTLTAWHSWQFWNMIKRGN
jgi:hypothetical protein